MNENEKVDIQEIANALLSSAAREEALLEKNASLQRELDALKENNHAISFVEAGGDERVEATTALSVEETPPLEKEASFAFDPYNMGEVASSDELDPSASARDNLMNWVNTL